MHMSRCGCCSLAMASQRCRIWLGVGDTDADTPPTPLTVVTVGAEEVEATCWRAMLVCWLKRTCRLPLGGRLDLWQLGTGGTACCSSTKHLTSTSFHRSQVGARDGVLVSGMYENTILKGVFTTTSGSFSNLLLCSSLRFTAWPLQPQLQPALRVA